MNEKVQTHFERATELLKILAKKHNWIYVGSGAVRVTKDIGLELRESCAAASGVIVEVRGASMRNRHRIWRRLSGLNLKADARVLLELAFSLPAKQVQLDAKRGKAAAWEQRRAKEQELVLGLAEAFLAATGRALLISQGEHVEAWSDSQSEARIKSVHIKPDRTRLVVEVPNELAAGLYNLIQHYRP